MLIGWGVLQFFSHQLGGRHLERPDRYVPERAAKSGYQQVLIRQALQGEPVRRFMNAESDCRLSVARPAPLG